MRRGLLPEVRIRFLLPREGFSGDGCRSGKAADPKSDADAADQRSRICDFLLEEFRSTLSGDGYVSQSLELANDLSSMVTFKSNGALVNVYCDVIIGGHEMEGDVMLDVRSENRLFRKCPIEVLEGAKNSVVARVTRRLESLGASRIETTEKR